MSTDRAGIEEEQELNTSPSADVLNPLSAVTHPDPYSYYASLQEQSPVYWDSQLKLWVVSSAKSVSRVFRSDAFRVRPIGEPVPKALDGTLVGEIFRRLVRMTDGPRQPVMKQAVIDSVARFERLGIRRIAEAQADRLFGPFSPVESAEGLNEFIFRMPIYVMAAALGVNESALAATSAWTAQLVQAFSPLASAEPIEEGNAAAAKLLDMFDQMLRLTAMRFSGDLARVVSDETESIDADSRLTGTANVIGLLTQSYEATAGLIGNTLVTLSRNVAVREAIKANHELTSLAVAEVVRFDPPVQNTRRFAAIATDISGNNISAGDGVLLILAAANRDPVANLDPDVFELNRDNRQSFTFGLGSHSCPGEYIARQVAEAAVTRLMRAGADFQCLCERFSYRQSANTRVPVFGDNPDGYI